VREIEYYRRRFQNRVFGKLLDFITAEAQRDHITKKEMAERLGKDPGHLSRLLSQPSNLTLDTISDILLALDAEAEPPEPVRFSDRRPPNYVHPLIARVTKAKRRSNYGDAAVEKSAPLSDDADFVPPRKRLAVVEEVA
jgi:hypothetical protein